MQSRKTVLAMIAASFLLAFAGSATAADMRGFRCNGFEPFWSLRIKNGAARYERAGFSPVTQPVTSTANAGGTWTITASHLLTAIITPLTTPICKEDPSGGAVPYTLDVTLTVGGQTLKGCCR